ncbi:MAG: 50S ribosomal protein L25 [Phycisphaerales bacterium]|nr:MAG: 50S ribosomal protein L25 [Phycisphaerales bacterium]
MVKATLLKAEVRESVGSRHAALIRRQGRIPAIVYGHKQEPVAVSLDAHNFVEELHHGRRLMDIQIGRKKEKMIVKDLQYDYLGKEIIHADLMRVSVTEKIRVTVPVELKGTAQGTHEGGIVELHSDRVEIECKATDIPEALVVSVKDLGVGDIVHAGDIGLPEGVRLVGSPETILVTCHLVAAAKSTEEVEAEEPAAPEVIREQKKAEEETVEEQ